MSPNDPTYAIPNLSKSRSYVLKNAALAIAGSMALWLSAKIQVPFYPVPMTLQTLVVLLIGAAYGWRLGAGTVALYLAQGAAGFAVFAGTPEKGIGLPYMLGPTGGYLFGFIAAAAIAGWLWEKGFAKSIFHRIITMTAAAAAIYAFGLIWLGSVIGYNASLFALGLLPFIYAEALKIAIASLLASPIIRCVQWFRSS